MLPMLVLYFTRFVAFSTARLNPKSVKVRIFLGRFFVPSHPVSVTFNLPFLTRFVDRFLFRAPHQKSRIPGVVQPHRYTHSKALSSLIRPRSRMFFPCVSPISTSLVRAA